MRDDFCAYATRAAAALTVFWRSIAIVIGPTPPGTGVIAPATSLAATFTFAYPTYACTLSGTLVQHGRQYAISGADYRCVQNGTTVFSGSANMSEITATAQGIEGRWSAAIGSGCQESAQFSAVLL